MDTHSTLSWPLAVILLFVLGACYVEVDDPACFAGEETLLIDEDRGITEACCDPDADNASEPCRQFFQDHTPFGRAVDLAICTPAGRCELDCRDGVNCACLFGADCGPDFGCVVSSDPAVCASQGQMGGVRCTVCENCLENADCANGESCQDNICQ